MLDLIDVLTVAGHVESPVTLSEEAPFRRKFSSVYDVLTAGEIAQEQLAQVLHDYFLKQHLGLTANQSTNHQAIALWMWLCVLAYWQLLLIGQGAADLRPAWHPRWVDGRPSPLTPEQVQRSAGRFWAKLGTPAAATRTAGKGPGRRQGQHPQRRQRYMRSSTRARNAPERPKQRQQELGKPVSGQAGSC